MVIYVLDKDFRTVGILDGYESLIWTDRYSAYGDFEVYTPITSSFLQYMIPDYYLWNSDSDRTMFIEDLNVVTEVDDGNHISIVGRSLESILERRVVWNKVSFTNKDPLEIIESVLNSEIENPTDTTRKIPNFIHTAFPSNLPERDPVTVDLWGETVYEVITTLLEPYAIGFKVVLNSDNKFVFSLYYGENRSYTQDKNPWIIFSSEYENLVDTKYSEIHSEYKNAILVKGEENTTSGTVIKVDYVLPDAKGLERKEVFEKSTDVSRQDENGNDIPESRYRELLLQKAKDTLASLKLVTTFEGAVETHNSFKFGKEYFMGDVVQIETPTGNEAQARITEIIHSFSDSGVDTVPTFSIIE